MHFVSYIVVLFLALCAHKVNGQNDRRLICVDISGNVPERRLAKKTFPDSISALDFVRQLQFEYHSKGYLLATVDTFLFRGDTLFFDLQPGARFEAKSVYLHAADKQTFMKAGVKVTGDYYVKAPVQQLPSIQKRLVKSMENKGYPFASVLLDSIANDSTSFKALLVINTGPYIQYDTLAIYGKTKTKARYIERYTGLDRDKPFRQKHVNRATQLIDRLPFLKTSGTPVVVFSKGKAEITYPVEDQKSNRIDGIVGVLPNSNNNNELVLTGEFNLNLNNLFSVGHAFNLNWKRFDALSQALNMDYSYPFVAGSPVGIKGDLSFLKQDSSFQTLNRRIEVFTSGGSFLRSAFFFGINSSTLISSRQYEGVTRLPEFSDFSRVYYGLDFSFDKRNDFYFPRRGYFLRQETSLGTKKIIKNAILDEKLYEGMKLNTLQLTAELAAQKFFNVSKNGVFLLAANGALLYNEDPANVFLNDLYRLGGFKLMRGFNENFFFATQYGVITAEWRQFTDNSSYLFAFIDQSFIKTEYREINRYDNPTGFGVGMSFATQAGIFNFAYSLGRSAEQQAIPALSKIHFGFVSRF